MVTPRQQQLQKLEQRQLTIRKRMAKLRREMTHADRRVDTQRKCALGGVLEMIATRGTDEDKAIVDVVRRYLAEHSANISNAEVLRGTVFQP